MKFIVKKVAFRSFIMVVKIVLLLDQVHTRIIVIKDTRQKDDRVFV